MLLIIILFVGVTFLTSDSYWALAFRTWLSMHSWQKNIFFGVSPWSCVCIIIYFCIPTLDIYDHNCCIFFIFPHSLRQQRRTFQRLQWMYYFLVKFKILWQLNFIHASTFDALPKSPSTSFKSTHCILAFNEWIFPIDES